MSNVLKISFWVFQFTLFYTSPAFVCVYEMREQAVPAAAHGETPREGVFPCFLGPREQAPVVRLGSKRLTRRDILPT